MNQTFKNTERGTPEPTVQCPFDPAHRISNGRLQQHLTKCRRAILNTPTSPYYPKVKNMVVCHFSSLHYVPKEKLKEHMKTCDRAGSLVKLMERPASIPPWANCVDESNLYSNVGGDDEDWEKDQEKRGPGSYDPNEKMKNNPHFIYNKQGLTKSQRREYANSRRRAAMEHQRDVVTEPQDPSYFGPESSGQPRRLSDCTPTKSRTNSENDEIESISATMNKTVIHPRPRGVALDVSQARVTPIGRGVGRGVRKGPPPGF